MRKNLFVSMVFLLGAAALPAQEGPAFFAEDFLNQSIIFIQNSKENAKCQALRIAPYWYLTAAHCVVPLCDKGCDISVELLQGELAASAVVRHTSDRAGRKVFVHPDYLSGNKKNIHRDMALVRFAPSLDEYYFADFRAGERLDYKTFMQRLQEPSLMEQKLQWDALTSPKVVLRTVSVMANRHLRQPLAVPVLNGEGIFFRQSQKDDFYYFADLRLYTGSNFGVEQGMSGSGVIFPGGDAVGVVSGLVGITELDAYNEEGEVVASVPYSLDKFYFAPFDSRNVRFIRSTVHLFHDKKGPVFRSITSQQAAVTEQSSAADPLSGKPFSMPL